MMNDLSAVNAFWTGLHPKKDCYEWASDKAYRDMARRLEYIKTDLPEKEVDKKRKCWRKEATLIIKKHIDKYQNSDFREFHSKCCEALQDFYKKDKKVKNFTIGHAQKWLNMMLKYLWLAYRLEMLNDSAANCFIGNHSSEFHVPLDSYILRYAAKMKKNKSDDELNNGLENIVKFASDTKWSNIDKYDCYSEYQEELKKAIGQKISPLEWELEHWPKALEYYDGVPNPCDSCEEPNCSLKK